MATAVETHRRCDAQRAGGEQALPDGHEVQGLRPAPEGRIGPRHAAGRRAAADAVARAQRRGHGTADVPAAVAPAEGDPRGDRRGRLRPHHLRAQRRRDPLPRQPVPQRGRLSLVARRVNTSIPDFEGLGLPPVLAEIVSHDQGIIILAGVTGSGKSTTIASMLNYVNKNERCHVVTIEDPIEFTFKDDKCIINQREVGIDVIDWDTALKHAVRQDPDIILVGEMRDKETFNAAMHAAETGHLVFGTIHASSAPSTISRILDLFPKEKTQVFTPLELDLNPPASVQSALAALVKRGRPIDFLLLNAGMVPGKKRVLTAAGIEAAQAPLIGHHQLTVGLLLANLLSPNARIVIAGAEPARGDVPMFSYTDVAAFAAKHHQGDRTAAVEALVRSGPNVKYEPNRTYADAKLIVAWWAAALARRLPSGMAVYAVSPGTRPTPRRCETLAWS